MKRPMNRDGKLWILRTSAIISGGDMGTCIELDVNKFEGTYEEAKTAILFLAMRRDFNHGVIQDANFEMVFFKCYKDSITNSVKLKEYSVCTTVQ